MKNWIGLIVNSQCNHGNKNAIVEEIKNIIGKDLIGCKTVCAPIMVDTGEYFIFIKCRNCQDHLEKIRKCHAIIGSIPSFDSPYLFSDLEVNQFYLSVDKPVSVSVFEIGDMVRVRTGYLKNLYGIIVDTLKGGKHVVAFSFYLRKFKESFETTELEHISKIKSSSEVCSGFSNKGLKLVNEHKIHREKHRKHPRNKKPK